MARSYTLKQISEWNKEGSDVILPDIQRGLVWTPQQIAFLWDSMLRGFPIGGFVFSENADNTYYLLDGQQRWNAISLGFNNLQESTDSILWFDISADSKQLSTRKYYIMPTTSTHPWGYDNDEDFSILDADEMREAIKTIWYNKKIDVYKQKVKLTSAYPYKAVFPIPLYVFITSRLKSVTIFKKDVFNKIEKDLASNWKKKFWYKENKDLLNKKITKLWNLFSRLQRYSITVNVLSKEMLAEDGQYKKGESLEPEKTNLEILFTRLNTGGTNISQEDLYYSAIKAYWGGIKDKVESIASGKISSVRLISTLFRLILTIQDKEKDGFRGRLTINMIRSLANNTASKNQIEKFIKNRAEQIVNAVDNKLSELPKYLKTKIISEYEEIYLLLLFLAYKKADVDYSGLALFLFFFVKKNDIRNNLNVCINTIYKMIIKEKEKTALNYKHCFQRSFSEAIIDNIIWNIESPEVFDKQQIEDYIYNDYDFDLIPSWYYFWNYVSTEKNFIVYAEKDYLRKEFPFYNPVNLRLCDRQNRPWDYDHIIPKKWSYNMKTGSYKYIVDAWLEKNGNFAAIPFSENRSKNAAANWDYYYQYKKELLFEDDFKNISMDLIYDEEMADDFSNIVFNRSVNIYKVIYTRIKQFIPSKQYGYQEVLRRRKYMEQLAKDFPCHGYKSYSMKFFYYSQTKNQDIEIENENNWNLPEITFGLPFNDDNDMIAFTWTIPDYFQIGIRGRNNRRKLQSVFKKHKDEYEEEGFIFGDEWWFVYKECTKNKNEIIHILRAFIDFMKENNVL